MATALNAGDGGKECVAQRRQPRQPALATALFAMWALLFVGGLAMFVYWIIADSDITNQERLSVGAIATMVAMAASWLLLVWRARVLRDLDRRVKGARGAMCLRCHAPLTHEGQEGSCPRCGEAFTLPHVRDVWRKHTP